MNNIHILNLSAYTSPVIEESKNKDFVQYGSDNNYFQYLIERYLYSNTNHAIITGVVNMIYGKGISATDSNRKPDQYAQMISIIKGDCLKKVALERKLLGMASMQVIYTKGKVTKVDHFPMNTLRAEKCNDKGEIEAWYYHHDWSKYRNGDVLKRIPAFGFGPLSTKSFIVETQQQLSCKPCGIHGRKTCPLNHFNCGNSIEMEQLYAPLVQMKQH
jgi:hypothetical protein